MDEYGEHWADGYMETCTCYLEKVEEELT